MPLYATMVAPLISMLANTVISSRIVLKSRASTVPVTVKFVTVLNSVGVMAEYKPPAVTFTVFKTCALSNNVKQTLAKSKITCFICLVF